MKKSLQLLLVLLGLGVIGLYVYHEYYLSKWYRFNMESLAIEVKSDECELCYLDWPIDHYFWIQDKQSRKKRKFHLYTEGPRLEFGFNEDKTQLAINCPGFATMFIDLLRMEKMEIDFNKSIQHLANFEIEWVIQKDRKLQKLPAKRSPNNNWE